MVDCYIFGVWLWFWFGEGLLHPEVDPLLSLMLC